METCFSEILGNFAMNDFRDFRWDKELATNPAAFYRAKSAALMNALPLFSKPPEMEDYLIFTPPVYADYIFTIQNASPSPITVDTGKIGFELCSVGLSGKDEAGNPYYTPLRADYDKQSGTARVYVTKGLQSGQLLEFDFYTDGVFVNNISLRQKRIIGLCIQAMWYEKFAGNGTHMSPKAKDKNFAPNAESADIRAMTERLKLSGGKLNDELDAYAQSVAYRNTVSKAHRFKLP
ncbi:MAG: hypothetical protein RR235_05000 [Oscillospiraceae bacterium]